MVVERQYVVVDCPVCDGHGIVSFEDINSEERHLAGKIAVDVAVRHGVTIGDLYGPSRRKEVCTARYEAMYRLREEGMSLKVVGRILGGRDHSTVLHGIAQHCERNGLPVPPRNNGW